MDINFKSQSMQPSAAYIIYKSSGPLRSYLLGMLVFQALSSANIGLADTGSAGPVLHLCKRTTFKHK